MKIKNRKQEISTTVVITSDGDIRKFANCMEQLCRSISFSKTQLILWKSPQEREKHICDDIFYNYCNKHNIEHQVVTGPNFDKEYMTKEIKGRFVCFLKEECLVSKNFLSRFIYAYENFPKESAIEPIGALVPIFTNAAGMHTVAKPEDLPENDVDAIQEKIEKIFQANPEKNKWALLGSYIDACIFIPKAVLLKLALPKVNVECDTTLGTIFAYELYKMGYYSLSCGNVYVYRDTKLESNSLAIPVAPHIYKQDDENAKLGVLFKVKIDSEEQYEVFKIALEQAVDYAAGIFVLDQGSKVRINIRLKEENPILWEAITNYRKVFESKDDRVAYNTLFDMAEAAGMTWTLSLRTGERLDSRSVSREYFQKLIHPINPFVTCYASNEFYLWDSQSDWRSDGVWGRSHSVRLTRLYPGHRIKNKNTHAFHCGHVPFSPPEYIRPANFRIVCSDFMQAEERMIHHEHMVKSFQNVDWNYLIDESGKRTYPWQRDISLSAYTPLHKADKMLLEWLDHIWSWVDHIYIGNDRNKLDPDTLILLERWGVHIVPTNMEFDFANGRNQIIKHIKTDFILQLDIDERVQDPLMVQRLMTTNNDAWMFAIENYQKDGGSLITETARLFRNKDGVEYWGYIHETIDDHLKAKQWKVGLSPIRLFHYGYQLLTPETAWTKMQRYMEINIKQMLDFPDDSRSYYNLAIHLAEDGFYDDALRLMIVSCRLSNGRILPVTELGKLHLNKATQIFAALSGSTQPGVTSQQAIDYSKELVKVLKQINPQNQIIAQGHARAFFDVYPEKRSLLAKHLSEMESKFNGD